MVPVIQVNRLRVRVSVGGGVRDGMWYVCYTYRLHLCLLYLPKYLIYVCYTYPKYLSYTYRLHVCLLLLYLPPPSVPSASAIPTASIGTFCFCYSS